MSDDSVAVGVSDIYLGSAYATILMASSYGISNMTAYCYGYSASIDIFECSADGDLCSLYCYHDCCEYTNVICNENTQCNIFCDEDDTYYCPNVTGNGNVVISANYDKNPNNIEFNFNNNSTMTTAATPTTTTTATTDSNENDNLFHNVTKDSLVFMFLTSVMINVVVVLILALWIIYSRSQSSKLKKSLDVKNN